MKHLLFSLLILSLAAAEAGELKVDINRDSKNAASETETGYTKWSQDSSGGTTSGTGIASKTFTTATGETVAVSFSQTALSQSRGGTGLSTNWYQVGAQGTAKLVSDGFFVAPATLATGGEIRMTLTGLSAGPHTLLTYHNHWDNFAAGSVGPINIYLNGALAVAGLQPTIRAAINQSAPVAYLEFSVSGPSEVTTILFSAETNTAAGVTIRNALISGFEIDTPNSTRTAHSPVPADADGHVDADTGGCTLSWSAATAGTAVSHDVYFGTSITSAKAATRASPEFKGNQTATTYPLAGLNSSIDYFWRIDEIDALGNATKGSVWSFRPRHLAFPGAEGYGRFARGGRGGRVVEVTSLADYISGETPIPGTLRHAVSEETGPRTVVFAVSGLITLRARLTMNSPYVTIAGQTAPGKGICIRQFPFGLSGANDAIVRFIRIRPGDISGQTIDGTGLAGCNHSIMDHCSISWSIDEAFSGRNAKNITLQRSLISEALAIAGHQNYPAGSSHGYAATIGGDVGSFHYNLLVNCEGRNWSLGGGLDAAGFFAGRLDIRNNVAYNWRNRTTDGGAHEVNFVNNYYKPGAATTHFYAITAQYDNFPGTQQYYMAGNVMPGYFNESNQAAGRRTSGFVPTTYPVWAETPFFEHHVTTRSAGEAYRHVLSDSGCNLPMLDKHDARVINETLTGTYTYTGTGPYGGYKGLPNSQDDVGGWENYFQQVRPASWDSDHDGMPDWWETIHGFNPDSAAGDFSDSNSDTDGDGYTALEHYLHWLAEPHAFTAPDAPLLIDLRPYAKGFTAASFSISSATHGSAVLSADAKSVLFTPASGVSGLGGFTFTISGHGATVSRAVGICISSHGLLAERRWLGGSAGNGWNETSLNWLNGSMATTFQPGNSAIFDETGSDNPIVKLEGNLAPFSITVSGSVPWFFTGSGLAAGTSITNTGTLDLLTYTGTLPADIVNSGNIIYPAELRISSASISGDTFQATMQLPAGHTYQLQKAPSLASPSWTDVPGQSKAGGAGEGSFIDASAAGGSTFYRVRATTP